MKNNIAPFNWRAELGNSKVDSIDEDVILIENPVIPLTFENFFKLDITVASICTKGSMKGFVNLKQYVFGAPCLFIVFADQILQYEYISKDFSGFFIIMSKRFTDSLFRNIQERFPLTLSIHDNPWTPLNKREMEGIMDYYRMLQMIIRIKEHPYRIEIARHLTQALFYGLSYQFHKRPDNEIKSKQDILVENFLTYVQSNYKEQRGLEFYADKLCLTPKYLSKVIKDNSGLSASEWIDNYVVLEAKALLQSTNMNIQQITEELNFPSQSFFGKYFKRHVGVSPKEYRKN